MLSDLTIHVFVYSVINSQLMKECTVFIRPLKKVTNVMLKN